MFLVEGPHLFELAKAKGEIVRVFATSTAYQGEYEFLSRRRTPLSKIADVESASRRHRRV
ncbi:MAG: hypothetical protein MZU79_02545 [Anaerotruncus sp.]|nr:hypothetical protein [Anaerotruncus sp.]